MKLSLSTLSNHFEDLTDTKYSKLQEDVGKMTTVFAHADDKRYEKVFDVVSAAQEMRIAEVEYKTLGVDLETDRGRRGEQYDVGAHRHER